MDILKLIKNRCTFRKYKGTPIPKNVIKRVIEAGRWGPSVHGFQPWRFVVITDLSLIKEISDILLKKARELRSGIDRFLFLTANTIANSSAIILVYNQHILRDVSYKLYSKLGDVKYLKIAELSEIQAISAALQNMILVADSLGVGSCWNTIPLFCEKEINKRFKTNEQLVAILTLGYPNQKGKRSPRKKIDKVVQYIC